MEVMSVNISWMADAACVGADPEIFFSSNLGDRHEARRICLSCPVIEQCADHRRATSSTGIWGGSVITQAPSRSPFRDEPKHGTDGGYQKHRRLGTPPCNACSEAHRYRRRRNDPRWSAV
jgi:hypothetical protein